MSALDKALKSNIGYSDPIDYANELLSWQIPARKELAVLRKIAEAANDIRDCPSYDVPMYLWKRLESALDELNKITKNDT